MRKTLPRPLRIWLLFRGDDQRLGVYSDLHSSNPSLFGICRLNRFGTQILVVDLNIYVKSRNIMHERSLKLIVHYEISTSTSISKTVARTPTTILVPRGRAPFGQHQE